MHPPDLAYRLQEEKEHQSANETDRADDGEVLTCDRRSEVPLTSLSVSRKEICEIFVSSDQQKADYH